MKKAPAIGVLGLCAWAGGYAAHRGLPLAASLSAMLLKVGIDIVRPWPIVFLIDYVLRGKAMPPWIERLVAVLPGAPRGEQLIGWTVAATIVLFLLSWAASVVTAYANISLGQRMAYDLAGELFARLQQLSLKFHVNKAVGDSIRRVTADCGSVATIFKDAMLPVISSVVTLVAIFAIMWRIDWKLTLLAAAAAPCMAVAFKLFARPMMDRSYEQQEVEGTIYNIAEQTFAAMPVVQAFTREEANDATFRAATAATLRATMSATRVQIAFKLLIGLVTAVATAAILWLGAHHALRGELTIGAIVLFLAYLASLYTPLEAIMYTTSTIHTASGGARRVMEILSRDRDLPERPGAEPVPSVKGHVRFENVEFGYETDRAVLKGISFAAAPGEQIAIVGATGAGKTTLVSLIPRFFDPWKGQVLIDGKDVRDLTLKSLRQQIAMVLQEPFLFPLTIAENIAYGKPQATMTQIMEAARAANAHEFVARLPNGYNTVVGERGATLSGGERQRISIARAFLKDAPILILDEPTSALDNTTESLLLDALQRLTAQRTTFVIAHRLTTIRRATRILVLEGGEVAETGTHNELLARNGIYARFYQLQS